MKEEKQTPPAKQKPGPKPTPAPANRPHLEAEWQHLRAWWKAHGKRYNVTQLAEDAAQYELGLQSKSVVNKLLQGEGRGAATAERLDALVKVLAIHYTPMLQK